MSPHGPTLCMLLSHCVLCSHRASFSYGCVVLALIINNNAAAASCREMIHHQWEQKVRGQSFISDVQRFLPGGCSVFSLPGGCWLRPIHKQQRWESAVPRSAHPCLRSLRWFVLIVNNECLLIGLQLVDYFCTMQGVLKCTLLLKIRFYFGISHSAINAFQSH